MNHNLDFDVLIVGAGPAGCAAAIRAATGGLRVALIEKAAFPRDLPGEALHPEVDQLFADLGVSAAIASTDFVRYPGWIRARANQRSFIPFAGESGLRFGYQAWRADLDSILLAQARCSGVTVAQPVSVGNLLFEDGRVAGTEVGGKPWRCRCVLDASGTTRWLSRSLRLRVQDFSPRLVARCGYFEGDHSLGVIPEFREDACGWTWLARVKENRCQCVQLSLESPLAPLAPPDCVPAGIRFRGADVTWRFVPECAGAGYFLLGDAAAVLDPAASSGVARALASGLKAAELIIQVVTNQQDPNAAASAYRNWHAQQFVEQARQLAARYQELDNPPVWLRDLEDRFAELEQLSSEPLANVTNAVITSS